MPVLSTEDFQKYFVNTIMYGDTDTPWPRETLMLYTCAWDIKSGGFKNKGDIAWSVLKNEGSMHTERILMNYLKQQLKTYTSIRCENYEHKRNEFKQNLHHKSNSDVPFGSFKLKAYLSYSPCSDCSKELEKFIREFHEDLDVDVSISFSTFYKHYEKDNWVGLLKLSKMKVIKLTTLIGTEKWNEFFEDMQIKGITKDHWKQITEDKRRKGREVEDARLSTMLQMDCSTGAVL